MKKLNVCAGGAKNVVQFYNFSIKTKAADGKNKFWRNTACFCIFAGLVFCPLSAQSQNAVQPLAEPIAVDLPSPELNAQTVQDVPSAEAVEQTEISTVSIEKNDVIEVEENLSFDLPQNAPNISESENAETEKPAGENAENAEIAEPVPEVVEVQLSDVLPDDVQNALKEINRELAENKETEKIEEDTGWEGWKITRNATPENPNRVEIATFEGKTASVTISGGFISDDKVAAIGRALDAAWLVPDLVIKSVSVYMEDTERFRFVLFPESFTYNDLDLCQFLPSGIAFSYSGALFYDVILKVGNVKPRLNGTYVEPADFAAQVYKGVMFPDMILEGNLQDRVARLEQALLGLASRGFYARPSKIDIELIQQVRMMYSENNLITKKEVMAKLKEQGIKYTSAEIDTIFVVLLGVIE
ncbi:MAG: hypothetical protein MJ196_00995 [Treponemataceae bacterium]|nr:hypothetical protein [Treponemataceae bacterium]